MGVTGVHLAAACKLVFKIARNDKNDHFFKNSNLLGKKLRQIGPRTIVSNNARTRT